jgi:UDP-N-acetylglucosamine 2-epimerase (non-hydrolysing)
VRRFKVMVIVGTRPEVIKLSRVLAVLDRHVDLCLVHSGQNHDYELNQIFFDELAIRRPDHYLDAVGETAAATIGRVITRVDEVLVAEAPDAVLLYGDTNTCLAVIPAKRRHVPVFHMEAGNRCFDDRVPEEINRRLVDHLSDVNLPLTEHARRHLLAEGLPANRIFVTGSPMKEVLAHHRGRIDASSAVADLGLAPGRYVLVSAHREENVDRPELLRALLATLTALARTYDVPVVVSTHPRTRARLDELGVAAAGGPVVDERVRFLRPFGLGDYVALQRSALCVVSDSGTLTEESSLIGFPAVMIRASHERPEGMDSGVLVSSVLRPDRVLAAVAAVTDQHDDTDQHDTERAAAAGRSALADQSARADRAPRGGGRRTVPDYEVDDVSRRVLRIILSYVDQVNRTVWYRDQVPSAEPVATPDAVPGPAGLPGPARPPTPMPTPALTPVSPPAPPRPAPPRPPAPPKPAPPRPAPPRPAPPRPAPAPPPTQRVSARSTASTASTAGTSAAATSADGPAPRVTPPTGAVPPAPVARTAAPDDRA